MYTGKVRLWVTYHWGNDEHNNDETICDEVLEQEKVGVRLFEICPAAWNYDDGYTLGDWDPKAQPVENPYDCDNWVQTVCYPWKDSHGNYFLALLTPAKE